MALKVSEVIDLIAPNYGDENPRTFLHTDFKYYGIDTNSGRTEISNLEEFNNKSLFIAPFGHHENNSIKYNILKDELKLSDPKDSRFANQTYRLLESERIGDGFEGELDDFVFTNEIFIKIIEADKIVSLIDLAVEKRKLKELIEAVVEIDNNLEPQEKLLPKLIEADSRSNINYKQLIIYGPAGVGKTFSIKKLVSNTLENDGLNISEENFEKQTIHTVFHPEYSYYDFFGKVMPTKDENNYISYDFLPGPFAQALSKAYKNIIDKPRSPDKVVLVIDELNRGNASSIFGGLFNLLDRNKKGISEYPLNIYGMEAIWLRNQIGEDNLSVLELYSQKINFKMYDQENNSLKIYIPDNLSIICTMNTSDQTIFSLDKAFQRRFNKSFKTAQNSINEYFKDDNIKIETKDDKDIIWRYFLLNLNKFIVDHAEVEDVDNATIGAFFVKPKGEVILEEDIKYTVMYYLWYDLFSGYRRDTLKEELDKLYKLYKPDKEFKNVNTFEQFVGEYNEFITIFTQNVATNQQDTTVAPNENVQ